MKNPPMKADHNEIGTNQIFKALKRDKYQIKAKLHYSSG
jgi:hypothetical protein